MRIIFFGCTKFSYDILNHLIEHNVNIISAFYIPEWFSISYSDDKIQNYNFFSIKSYCESLQIPSYEVDSVKGKRIRDYRKLIEGLKPDIILVMGWYYMVPEYIRMIAKYGAWGIHASLLPKYAGGAPLVWAIIKGENETGVSLFRLDNGVDDGDLIAQEKFIIEQEDTIREIYIKATESSKKILLNAITNIETIEFVPQDKSKLQVYPQRRPEDGEIDLSMTSKELFNFIRAQSNPYPGAFINTIDGKKLILEKVRIE